MEGDYDVCVLGAGASGLACARRLVLLAPGTRVAVLEGRDRVGGRTFSAECDGDAIDLGGQWVGPEQPRVLELINELGLRLIPQTWFGQQSPTSVLETHPSHQQEEKGPRGGSEPASLQKACSLSSGSSVPLSLQDELALQALGDKLEALAAATTYPPCAASSPDAPQWDGSTVADFLDAHATTPAARRELELFVRTVTCTEPDQLSLLCFLSFLRACGGLAQLGDTPGGAQSYKVAGGTQQLSGFMAKDVQRLGGSLLLQQTVSSVRLLPRTQGDGDDVGAAAPLYEVSTQQGVCIRARRVVVALPPPLWPSIVFKPALPPSKQLLASRMYMGSVVKTISVFESAFWAGRPTVGQLEEQGPVANLFPSTVAGRPALVGLVTAAAAAEFSSLPGSDAARREAVLAQYGRYFATPAPLQQCVSFACQDWCAEPLSGGGYAAMMPPGLATACGSGRAMLEPAGGLHFAGTELARHWPGYIEGALESGYRVADELLEAL